MGSAELGQMKFGVICEDVDVDLGPTLFGKLFAEWLEQ